MFGIICFKYLEVGISCEAFFQFSFVHEKLWDTTWFHLNPANPEVGKKRVLHEEVHLNMPNSGEPKCSE